MNKHEFKPSQDFDTHCTITHFCVFRTPDGPCGHTAANDVHMVSNTHTIDCLTNVENQGTGKCTCSELCSQCQKERHMVGDELCHDCRQQSPWERSDIGAHMSHCYQGEYETSCKYGDGNDCPAKPKRIEITITIGESSITYIAALTDAPESYDGFGTFTIEHLGFDDRIVLIPKEQVDWQTSRYASGMKRADFLGDSDDEYDVQETRNTIINQLRKRIVGAKE